MEDNKSPGHDGLPKECYSTFWETIKGDKHTYIIIYFFNKKQLSNTQKLAIITLVPKSSNRNQ